MLADKSARMDVIWWEVMCVCVMSFVKSVYHSLCFEASLYGVCSEREEEKVLDAYSARLM